MVEALNVPVGKLASIPLLALLLGVRLAEVGRVERLDPSSVHLRVEVEAHLDVVGHVKLAALTFEISQVQVLHDDVSVASECEKVICLRGHLLATDHAERSLLGHACWAVRSISGA